MTDPTKALADAARDVTNIFKRQFITMPRLRKALAAYDAAQATEQVPPTDEEIEAWHRASRALPYGDGYLLSIHEIRDALALMRRASPNRQVLPTTVYVVMGGFDYEGSSYMGAFLTREGADACAAKGSYDHTEIEAVELEIPNRQVPLDSSLLQRARDVLTFAEPDEKRRVMRISTDWIDKLRAEVERASKGGAA